MSNSSLLGSNFIMGEEKALGEGLVKGYEGRIGWEEVTKAHRRKPSVVRKHLINLKGKVLWR